MPYWIFRWDTKTDLLKGRRRQFGPDDDDPIFLMESRDGEWVVLSEPFRAGALGPSFISPRRDSYVSVSALWQSFGLRARRTIKLIAQYPGLFRKLPPNAANVIYGQRTFPIALALRALLGMGGEDMLEGFSQLPHDPQANSLDIWTQALTFAISRLQTEVMASAYWAMRADQAWDALPRDIKGEYQNLQLNSRFAYRSPSDQVTHLQIDFREASQIVKEWKVRLQADGTPQSSALTSLGVEAVQLQGMNDTMTQPFPGALFDDLPPN